MKVRTRFAPSPTGFLHIGGARTALFSRAYARRHGGTFVLRIEDTDTERSTAESVNAILDGMKWLGLDWEEGPFFQMKRLARYREVAEQLIASGHAYWDYMSREELEKRREAQLAQGQKPKFDRRWKPELPKAEKPVLRFATPSEGEAGWNDLVKGAISFPNAELDDLVLLRADGVPTYNFGVVVDDIDMDITHVIRGDDHVNNTPRQIHIFNALGKPLPQFAHLPMILGHDGERLSKRHGAVSVLQYRDEGYLPEALCNYLARLGWSHGDDEVFSMRELEQWFDFAHVSGSPARFDPEKLGWLNQQYLKNAGPARLAGLVAPLMQVTTAQPPLEKVLDLLKDRAKTVQDLAEQALPFYLQPKPPAGLLAQHVTAESKKALGILSEKLKASAWEKASIGEAIKETVKLSGLKMPQIAMPLRVLVLGLAQTPSVDAVLELLGRDTVLERLEKGLQ